MKGTKVKRLVLDASGIRGTSRSAFEACKGQYELLAIEDLFVELYTHCEKGESFSKEQASMEAHKYFTNAASLPILRPHDPVRFEVEEGRSARECPHDKFRVPSEPFQPSDVDLAHMRVREGFLGTFWDYRHPPECGAAFHDGRRLQSDKELWPHMTESLNNDGTINLVRENAVACFMEMGGYRGWTVSNSFCPDRQWLTFGAILAWFGYIRWKQARHGDNIPQRASPANPSYDMVHVAHMAICDGLLSTDPTMLNIAWACWPEKRDGLMTYDHSRKAIVPYEPSWQKSSIS